MGTPTVTELITQGWTPEQAATAVAVEEDRGGCTDHADAVAAEVIGVDELADLDTDE